MNKVFVYGTLKLGEGNHSVLGDSKFLGNAVTQYPDFEMFSNGYYPMVIPGDKHVTGELYEVDDEVLKDLDMLEGKGVLYDRFVYSIQTDSGEKTSAYMYIYRGYPDDNKSFIKTEGGFETWMKT